MEKESGRTFRVELGRMEKDPTAEQSQDPLTSQEVKDATPAKNGVTKDFSNVTIDPPAHDMIWVRYYAN